MPNETTGERLLARRYRLMAQVGHGGMGTVWQAHDEVLGRDVAVKEVILPHGLTDEERTVQYKRTFREARTAARLGHPGVVTVYDVVEEDGRPWIVMELIRARSLDLVIKQDGPLEPPRAAEIGRQMLAALHAAHEAGVLHRDVKPSNVLVADGDRAVLTDFGIATAQGDATLTQTGLVMGSPAYIAPERARGKVAGPASDLWSLGVTLYAMVEGRSPFERSEPMAALVAIISEDPLPPPESGPLSPVIEGLLRKNPDVRMSAQEAGMLLDDIVRVQSVDTQRTRPVPLPPPESPPGRQPAAQPDPADRSVPAQHAQPMQPVEYEPEPVEYEPEPSAFEPDAYKPEPSPYDEPAPYEPDPSPYEPEVAGTRPVQGHPPGPARGGGSASTVDAMRHRVRTDRKAQVIIAVVLAALLLLVGAVALAGTGDDEKDPVRKKTVTSAPKNPPPSASSPSQPPPKAVLPAGFRTHKDRTGFSIPVPKGWSGPEHRGSSVYFRSPDRGKYIQVDQTSNPNPSALKDWEQLEPDRRGSAFPGYTRLKLAKTGDEPPVPDTKDGAKSADWEFTWSAGSGRMHGLNRGFVANGKGYAIFLVAPDKGWAGTREELAPIYAFFKPAPR